MTSLYLIKPDEYKRQQERNTQAYTGWTLQKIAEFAFLHISNPIGQDFRFGLLKDTFPEKTLTELIELHKIINSILKIRQYPYQIVNPSNKIDYKQVEGEEAQENYKKSYIEDVQNLILS